jgi:serine/threonine-protein kinase
VEPGYLLYAAGTVMQAVRFDLAGRAVLGEPAPLAEQVAVLQAGVGQLAVSQSGMLVYIPLGALDQLTAGDARTIVWVNREGREEPIVGLPPRVYFALRLSPDGTRMALDVRDQESDIWIWDFARRTLDRLTFDPGGDAFPVWTPDSRRVIFGSSRTGPVNLYAQSADGTGTTERLGDSPHTQAPGSVLPDGSGVLYTQTLSPQNPNIFLARLSAKGTDSPVVNSPATERLPQISPDGRFIAFDSDETTRMEIYVRPFPDVNGGRWRVSTAGGSKPVWSPAGGELFYHDDNSNTLMVVPVQTSPSFKVGTPTRLFATSNVPTLASALFYDAARDAKRFVMIKELPPQPGTAAAVQGPTFVVVVNWLESLRAALAGK